MDNFWLLFWGIIMSFLAWLFWHYTGENGFQILLFILVWSLIFDNRKLRKRLKHYEEKNQKTG